MVRYSIMIPLPSSFSIVTSNPWLKNRKYLPASHRCTVWVRPGQGWLHGPSSGCSRLFGRTSWMRCSPEAARAQLLALPTPWVLNLVRWRMSHEKALSTHSEYVWLLFNLQPVLSIWLLWYSIFTFSLVISVSEIVRTQDLCPLFLSWNKGLQFLIWKIEK